MKALALLLLSSVAFAGITSTEAPTVYSIYLDDGTIEKGKQWPVTEAECLARAKALMPTGTCVLRRKFANVGTCDDISKPVLPRELDADGYVIKPPIRAKEPATGNDWLTEIQDYVPAPYPACWVLGWREIAQADLDQPDDELASVMDPTTWPADLQAKWDASEAERHYAHVYYPGDTLP